ncbi:proline dipeptidase [Oceanicola granulosus HTCC2516]|uniref:Proline dipeptidase n=1 Tax=Oceanicola granulosus (strain ATCC BAA-861 / DSM 15982 / KCTC 12143 / HTCC2516) TaxID=314256 RepID=Q2CJF7_OCEGH|nr:Xaa-Pro peptidase family protein [Oceanicola granulosus]EAR52643.1 proline dipeptidase [Oceanicola granulosus HTCC2516]
MLDQPRFRQILPPAHYEAIHAGIRAAMARDGLDLLLLEANDDIIYTTGFSHYTTERPVVFAITADDAVLLVPRLEITHAQDQAIAADLVSYFEFPGVTSPFEALRPRLGEVAGRVGVAPSMSLGRLAHLRAVFPRADIGASGIVGAMRLIKTPAEIALHREAGRIADEMVAAGVALIDEALRRGGTLPSEIELESHVSRHAMRIMHEDHADRMLVQGMASGLVYSGARSAFPHAMPTGNPVKVGESLILSLGCRVGGRASESERTFFIGEPTAEQAGHYAIAFEAQRRATAAMVAGNSCAHADAQGLDHIRANAPEEWLLHRVGHGMGVMFHEPPWVEAGDETVLAAGMVTSSEPSITVPGFAGYRIADTIHVTEAGPDLLTHHPRRIDDIVIG